MKKILVFISLIYSIFMDAQISLEYQTPHSNIMQLADVPMAPALRMDSKGEKAILLYRDQYKSISDLSEKELKLAGLRINPVTNIDSREVFYNKVKLLDIASSKEYDVTGLPLNPRLSRLSWNHAQTKAAVLNTTATTVELWVVDLKLKSAKRLIAKDINANVGTVMSWQKDDKSIIVSMLPTNRKAITDRAVEIPKGPIISENNGQKAQNRTYQDLLKNPTDEMNFEKLVRSELVEVNMLGAKKLWKKNAMHTSFRQSPDGKYYIVEAIERPFSYIVPMNRFPSSLDVYDANGVFVKNIDKSPLIEEVPKGFMATTKGKRGINWRADKASELYWVEALDGGDPEVSVDYRDAVYTLPFPYIIAPKVIYKSKERYAGILWGNDNLAVVYESWWNTRNSRTLFFNPSDMNSAPVIFKERSSQDVYSDPGSFATVQNQFDRNVLYHKDNECILIGDGYSDSGKNPFIKKYNMNTKATSDLYNSKMGERLEDIASPIDIAAGTYLTRIESKTDFPNFFIRNINTNTVKQITKNANPFSALQNVSKEVITYKRDDGLELNGTLYLPVGYDKASKEKLPMIMWAYPREFKDTKTASQNTNSPYEFTYPNYGSPIYWLNRGYAVLDDAAFPIVGVGEKEPNDSFLKQLVANAKAGIDAVDNLGYIDRSKVAVGGHSYGAFMTANLLSHSNLFAAGIARSGAYNRTLTPFGFQSEERSYWDAPEIYYDMSPFSHADKMKTPLLLIHGEDDNNSGTFPMQSERYFNALKGLGATVRLVMLPKESHGYAAKESIMHMLWEQDQWLDKHVKNRKVVVDAQP
jgi:dipeptidyl aminopeptidase/acylaminoacyl peptidase